MCLAPQFDTFFCTTPFVMTQSSVPSGAQSAVLMRSDPLPEYAVEAIGPQFDQQNPNDLSALMERMATVGFQGTSVSEAVRIIERMVRIRQLYLTRSAHGV